MVGDLFSEDGYFANAEAFWSAQDEAIAARRDAYLAAKWPEVVVLERGARFPEWEFAKISKKAGGRVYIEPTHTGEVRFHEGYLTQREASKAKTRKAEAENAPEADGQGEAPCRPAITKTMQNYLDLHRHSAVRLAVLARPADALRLLIAHAVAASGNGTVRPDSRRAESEAIRESLAGSEAQRLFEAEAKQVRKLLAPAFQGEGGEEGGSVAGQGHDDGLTVQVFQRLQKLKDADVARIATFVMAETLASGSEVTECFGALAKVDARAHWTPDQAFFDLMRDRTSVNAMLADLSGKKAADKLVSAKLKEQKAALATAATSAPQWCPGWMRFPAADC